MRAIEKMLQLSSGDFFDWQIANLQAKNYDRAMGKRKFSSSVEVLREVALGVPSAQEGCIPFLVVLPKSVLRIEQQISRVILGGKYGKQRGVTTIPSSGFKNMKGLRTPSVPYLVLGIGLGMDEERFRVPVPDKRAELLAESGRSPLTIEEGVSLTTHFPELLRDDWTLCLHGSRALFMGQVQGLFRFGGCCEDHILIKPMLGFVPSHMQGSSYLVPSCSSRLVL